MVILLTGITGLIGSHLARALRAAGHRVIGTHRGLVCNETLLHADFTTDVAAGTWLPRLSGVDVVINAVGIFRESGSQTFATVHARVPQALFSACAVAGVHRVIQISALGAETGITEYFRSKHAADQTLETLPLDWVIVQPSLVYAPGGASARLFSMLATLPVLPLPGSGEQRVQPIHIDDLTAAIAKLCDAPHALRCRIPLVGPQAVSIRELLQQLRQALSLEPAPSMHIPMPVMRAAAGILGLGKQSLLNGDSLAMLMAGNTANPRPTTQLLGTAPRPVTEFIEPELSSRLVQSAMLKWLLPTLRVSVAVVWIWTAIVSFGLYPASLSLELLGRTGVPPLLAPLLLYGAASLDLAFGLSTLFLPRVRWLWLAQIGLIVLYSVVIAIQLPEFWLHPYGPMIKNLPMITILYCLYLLERPAWNT